MSVVLDLRNPDEPVVSEDVNLIWRLQQHFFRNAIVGQEKFRYLKPPFQH